MNVFNFYCDESCHLENDGQAIMLIGGIWCPANEVSDISKEIRVIKNKHKANGEIKWTKVSNSRIDFFKELVRFFFTNDSLHFRCLIVDNKEKLDHSAFNKGSHDNFYYKMYYSMLNKVLSPDSRYNIYLDIKDTRSQTKVDKLRKVLCNNFYDFTGQMIAKIQHIRSEESEILQLADFLIGAVSYDNRELITSKAKLEVIKEIKKFFPNLGYTTSLYEKKFNLFFFCPQEGCNA